MPKRTTEEKSIRHKIYLEKMLALRTGKGHYPEYLAKVGIDVADEMYRKWNAAFSKYATIWKDVVVPVLKGEGKSADTYRVKPLDWAKYRAFMNRYISKVKGKGIEKAEDLVRHFVEMYECDEAVLRDIIAAIEKL